MITVRKHGLLTSTLVALSGVLIALMPLPSRAIERLHMILPLLETEVSFELGQAETAQQLLLANPDLAELDRVGEGAVTRVLEQMLTAPLPDQSVGFLSESAGQPLFEQALLAASELMDVEGLSGPLTGADLRSALKAAYRDDQPNLLGLLRHLPGTTASIDLQALVFYANRLARHQRSAQRLIAAGREEQSVDAARAAELLQRRGWRRMQTSIATAHRSQPLELVILQPSAEANGQLVVISHGLWDEPASFEGWGQWLASRGYTVVLPVHQGSDLAQQQAMLMGDQPPPQADELRLRPLDVTALIDAVAAGDLLPGVGLDTDAVAMVGHSWGATTTLQVAGLRTTDEQLMSRCQDPRDPERNLSWLLQCSWLKVASDGSLGDPRIKVAVAVSPPLRLLFDPGSGHELTAKVLLVSGSSDWLVPSGPEAVTPLRNGRPLANGHRLVLASGGGHFNLRAPSTATTSPVLAPLIEAWINQQLQPASSFRFDRGGWGSDRIPLVDVTSQL